MRVIYRVKIYLYILPVSPHAEKNHVFSGLEFCLLMTGQGNNRRAGGKGFGF
jgi:hypothetical protein